MHGLSVFRKTLRDQRWQIAGYGGALALIAMLDVLTWPSFRDALQNFEIPASLQAFLGSKMSIATPAGFLSARFYSWIPVLLLVYAVMAGTGAIAGEEGSGTMDLLLAQPVSRRSVVLQKAGAIVAGCALIVALGIVGFVLSVPFISIKISVVDTAIASLNMLPMTLLFFAVALWAGAVAPSRAIASSFVIGIATAAYFANTIALGISSLYWLKYSTPFYYYGAGDALVQGVNWWHAGLLLGIAAGFVGLTLRSYERRDVSLGGSAELGFGGTVRRILARRGGV